MGDPYCPFMGTKGKSWGELELQSIAGRVAGPPEAVALAVRAVVDACRKNGVSPEQATVLLEEAFRSVSAPPSSDTRRR